MNNKKDWRNIINKICNDENIDADELPRFNPDENLIGKISDDLRNAYINGLPKPIQMKARLNQINCRVSMAIKGYNQAAIIAYIIYKLNDDKTLGRVKLQKILYLIEMQLITEIKVKFVKNVAGPHDILLEKYEELAQEEKWFYTIQEENTNYVHGKRIYYKAGENFDGALNLAQRLIGNKNSEVVTLIDKFKDFNTPKSELIATTYAAWNELICKNIQFDEKLIIKEFFNWHESKERKFKKEEVLWAIEWLKENNILPTGKKGPAKPR